jgi:lipocalin
MEFNLKQYLGDWFEIARINNYFEPNMTNVTARYTLINKDEIEVINKGYINGQLFQIKGIAKTTSTPTLLKVSFFKNMFSDYQILFVDEEYQYALVGGKSPNYLWILSRTKELDNIIIDKLINIAKENKYNIDKIGITEQLDIL